MLCNMYIYIIIYIQDVNGCKALHSQILSANQEFSNPTCVSLFLMSFRHRLRLLFVSGPEANRNAPERGKRGERSENTKWGPLRLGPTPNMKRILMVLYSSWLSNIIRYHYHPLLSMIYYPLSSKMYSLINVNRVEMMKVSTAFSDHWVKKETWDLTSMKPLLSQLGKFLCPFPPIIWAREVSQQSDIQRCPGVVTCCEYVTGIELRKPTGIWMRKSLRPDRLAFVVVNWGHSAANTFANLESRQSPSLLDVIHPKQARPVPICALVPKSIWPPATPKHPLLPYASATFSEMYLTEQHSKGVMTRNNCQPRAFC